MKQRQSDTKYILFITLLLTSVIGFYQLCRISFYLFNNELFDLGFFGVLKTMFYGLRFDISAILYLNSIFILFWLVPFRYRNRPYFRIIMKWSFITVNSIALFANLADVVYYRFTLKRTTADIFSYFGVGGEFDKLLPQFLKDFWYVAILFIIMVYAFVKLYHYIEVKILKGADDYSKWSLVIQTMILIFTLCTTVVGMRGGFQLRPINIITAGGYSQGNASALILNTPFTIMQTIGKQELKPLTYFETKDLNAIYSPYYSSFPNNTIPKELCTKKNVVLIIVESLSMEHVGFYNSDTKNHGFTPFVDKIAEKGMVFYGMSNGKKSIEGIPAIISGVPTLMNTPFISSPYSGNNFNSLPQILKDRGYYTAFFHGGMNGTMGFDAYCKTAGYQSYFGKSEYSNKLDDDGSWGIWDEPYLQYFKNQMDGFKQPFFTTVFTLSSHHPFKIPSQYIGKFPSGKLPIQQTIAYADYSLQRFFESAAKSTWFENTLFVITADHTSEADLKEYQSDYGVYRIPVIFYDPSHDLSHYSSKKTAQQIDIMPTVLSYLGVSDSVFCFGNNLLDSNKVGFSICFKQPNYQLVMNDYMITFDGANILSLYYVKEDKELKNNLLNNELSQKDEMLRFVKAFLQHYNNALIYNKMNY